jgi:hypothetical protein
MFDFMSDVWLNSMRVNTDQFTLEHTMFDQTFKSQNIFNTIIFYQILFDQ